MSETRRPAWRGDRGVGGDLEVARRYIEQLKIRPPEEAVPLLAEILDDESWYLRDRAGAALAAYGEKAAPTVEGLLEGGLWFTRAAALRVLGVIAAPRSLAKIIPFLRDPNRTIAEEAARALVAFCERDRALAAAKLLHERGATEREQILARLRRFNHETATRLQRLVSASALMGAEGTLAPEDRRRLVEEVSDRAWGISWESLAPSVALPEPQQDLVRFLHGREAE